MVLLMFASLVGASLTFLFLWPWGGLLASAAAPFGGSLFTLVAGIFLAMRRSKPEERFEAVPDETDAMVAALRQAAAMGRRYEPAPVVAEEAACPAAASVRDTMSAGPLSGRTYTSASAR